ncbi:MAG: TolC family protein [Myxococcales bacterium]|nr:TolC family protein [Myxococcales bacterium]MCB9718643.1 TolC family protein [Myxococcales bacterium]
MSAARARRGTGPVALARVVLGLLMMLWIPQVRAETLAAPLELDEVLESVRRTHPGLEGAKRAVDERDALEFAARGGFDPKLAIRGKWAPVGYYPQGQIDALVQQATPVWGIGLYAGYRLGLGSYPIYKGDLRTLSGGELRAGVSVPLWRGGLIDERRAELRKARIAQKGARLRYDAEQLALERDAAKAYWSWVAAGQSLEVAERLLEIAEARDAALRDQVAAGSIPAIVIVDNQRLVLDRKAKVVAAELELQAAALDLSLYLRDDRLRPVRPGRERLPERMPGTRGDLGSLEDAVALALQQRPDALALAADREAAEVEVRLARNQRAPAIDLQAFAARDLGDGPAELRPTELGVGITVEVDLPLRKARGKHRAAQARAGRIDAERRALRDGVEAEVREAWLTVEAAAQRVVLARLQRDAADQLAEAERELLHAGSSDLLDVNLRERAAADAATLEIDALADYHSAHAELAAAVGGAP